MNILAVIPARGGSKGIPKKNIRFLNGEPLIAYSIKNGLNSKYITDVVVTTDSEEIANVSKHYGAEVIMRETKLAKDEITLDPVIYNATIKTELMKNKIYDIVITLQPTSPGLKVDTLDDAIQNFIENKYDTVISAVNKPHLSWTKQNNRIIPKYEKRMNRQQLPENYVETGAFVISNRKIMKENTRMEGNISIYELPPEESSDIDTVLDWMICESLLRRKKIVLRCDGYKKIGMGHIYHCLTLAYALTGNEIMFVTNKKYREGVKKLQEAYMPYTTIEDDEEFFEFLKKYKPDIIINDCLDTKVEYIEKLKELANRVVTIEDRGEGAQYADITINALYNEKRFPNEYCGKQYVCLRNEFLMSNPKEFNENVENVLVMFGGTDPSNLTKKMYELLKEFHKKYRKVCYTFITGIGYNCEKNGVISDENYNIKVINNVDNISYYMGQADIAFTSQGRTVYELATLGVPSIVLAQNKRELLHTFAQMQNGFINLGLGKEVAKETIENTLEWLIKTPRIRQEMRNIMLSNDLKNGLNKEIELILNENKEN